MPRFPFVLLVSTALLAGCSKGKLRFSDDIDFGGVKSATWLEVTSNYDGGSYTYHSFVLTNKSGFCGDYRTAIEKSAEAYELYDSIDDYYGPERCEYLDLLLDGYSGLTRAGTRWMSVGLQDTTASDEAPPTSGTYDLDFDLSSYYYVDSGYGDPSPPSPRRAFVDLTFIDANIYKALQDDLDCGDPNWYDSWYESYDDLYDENNIRYYNIDDGTVEVEASDTSYSMLFEGMTVEDDDGNDAGTLEGKANLKRCEIEVDGYAYLYL